MYLTRNSASDLYKFTRIKMENPCQILSYMCPTIRNEDRDDRNRKSSYDVKEGTADCEDWSAGFIKPQQQKSVV